MSRESESLPSSITPATPAEGARYLRDACEASRGIVPVGGRTALRYGWPVSEEAVPLSTSAWNKVVDYPAADMTITVQSGMRVADLQELLQTERQRLPIDIPEPARATLGGALATATSGPGRFGHGTLRDYVIGISAIDGQGRTFSSGGRVVKNVAGYDLCKLLTGSLGTLAVITQVSLKLRPLHETRVLTCLELTDWDSGERVLAGLLTSQTRPVAIELINPKTADHLQRAARVSLPLGRPLLCVAFEGLARGVDWQVERYREELAAANPVLARASSSNVSLQVFLEEEATRLWEALVDYQAASDDPLTFQITLPASRVVEVVRELTEADCAIQAHAGSGIIIGHLSDQVTTAAQAWEILCPLWRRIESWQGACSILACDDTWKELLPVFSPLPAAWQLMRDLKRVLDPQDILSPGRLRWQN